MKDYSAMSDFEINKQVAIIQGHKCYYDNGSYTNGYNKISVIVKGNGIIGQFNPCNNPADAWPIIISNRISLMFDASTEEGNEAEWCLASSPCDQIIVDYVTPDKMLRAAMIVYLQMMEQK